MNLATPDGFLNLAVYSHRLFQMTDQFHADELPTSAGIDKLDKLRFRDFLHEVYELDYPEAPADRLRLLQNMNLATPDGFLNLAGILLFAQHPQWIKPQYIIKGIRYYGDAISTDDYLDTEDFTGPLRKVFEDALAFIMRNLHKIQAARAALTIRVFPKCPASCLKNCWSMP